MSLKARIEDMLGENFAVGEETIELPGDRDVISYLVNAGGRAYFYAFPVANENDEAAVAEFMKKIESEVT